VPQNETVAHFGEHVDNCIADAKNIDDRVGHVHLGSRLCEDATSRVRLHVQVFGNQVAMLNAASKAMGDMVSSELRTIMFRTLILTLVLFAVVIASVEILLSNTVELSWPWADWAMGLGMGIFLLIASLFLMPPTVALFAGLFLDEVAALVERKHYSLDKPGIPLSGITSLWMALRFSALALLVNLLLLPAIAFGVGAILMLGVNAYLISREYFEMAAMRHMTAFEARDLRRRNAPMVFIAGTIPAALSIVPFVNFLAPLYSTSYFIHLFKRVQGSSA